MTCHKKIGALFHEWVKIEHQFLHLQFIFVLLHTFDISLNRSVGEIWETSRGWGCLEKISSAFEADWVFRKGKKFTNSAEISTRDTISCLSSPENISARLDLTSYSFDMSLCTQSNLLIYIRNLSYWEQTVSFRGPSELSLEDLKPLSHYKKNSEKLVITL